MLELQCNMASYFMSKLPPFQGSKGSENIQVKRLPTIFLSLLDREKLFNITGMNNLPTQIYFIKFLTVRHALRFGLAPLTIKTFHCSVSNQTIMLITYQFCSDCSFFTLSFCNVTIHNSRQDTRF